MEKTNCVYRFIDKNDEIIYVGKAKVLDNRIGFKGHKSRHLPDDCYDEIVLIQFVEFKNENDMDFSERYYIQKYRPRYNKVYIDKQITIGVPELDIKLWFEYSRNNDEILHQLKKFSDENIIKYSKYYKYISIKTNVDIFDYVLFYILRNNYYAEMHKLYKELDNRNELYKLRNYWGYENLEEEHKEYENIDKLDKLIKIEENIYNELKKELDPIFKRYPLLEYKIAYIPTEYGSIYDENYRQATIFEFNQHLKLGKNKFSMWFLVYGKYNTCNSFNCNTCNRKEDCDSKMFRIRCTLEVECK